MTNYGFKSAYVTRLNKRYADQIKAKNNDESFNDNLSDSDRESEVYDSMRLGDG
jgi:hypothetical protein